MSILDGIGDFIFGGTEQQSTLTGKQDKLLKQLGGLQSDYNSGTYRGLNRIAKNPNSAYEYNADNGEAAFESGVVNPALQQLREQIANTSHSSQLHSSANRYAQDQLKQNTMNNLSNMKYQNMIQQQQFKQGAQENAYTRQQQALAQLLGGNQTVLGTQGTAMVKQPGLLDGVTAVTGAAKGVSSLF